MTNAVTVTNPTIDAAAREKLITARIGLLIKAPFFGNIATRMELTNADEWCRTAATDGRKFYYNSEFINKMPLRQVEFLVGHETLHPVYDHMGRRGDRDPQVWNIAADYCVNADLIDQKIGERIPVGLYSDKYRGWSADQVYDDLMKNASKLSISDMLKQMFDEHLDGNGDGDEDEDGESGEGKGKGGDGDKEGKGRPKLTDDERRDIKDEIRDAMLGAAAAVGAGNVPLGVQRLIKELTESVISWQELLEQQIQSTIKSDFSWARPSRKGWDVDAILPGMKNGQTIDISVSIDQSGSITAEDSKIFLSEIRGIMDSYTEYNIRVWCFDTQIYNDKLFTTDNMEDIAEYEPMGGGGTDFEANWEYMKENEIEPKKFIMFTDGMPNGGWGDENYCDTVWIIKGNPSCKPPWGTWAHYEAAVKGK